MGIPKFLRWLSERYPCISQVITDDQVPVFDNLYLDMNGIIHNCSHGNSTDPNFQVTEETIFNDCMAYIDYIFQIIKPRGVFYMAIDGVAPRAKMNQQRSRRFRTALEAEELKAKAIAEGVELTGERFDSNCITPGTPFMARLSAQLKYFVNLKVSTDIRWQGVKVIFSGHETPGEGEHKIMDYIRKQRSLPTWDPNTRHCLYGLDADLIVLGLLTHEPHFSLLREEVTFGGSKSQRVQVDAKKVNFNLLHLSLVREYTMVEFATEAHVDFERVLDDWVLICYLVGNDFIPHLPNLHINTGALDLLFDQYKALLTGDEKPRYLNDSGHLNLVNFQEYMRMLNCHDLESFDEYGENVQYLTSKLGTVGLDYTSAVTTEESETDTETVVEPQPAVHEDGFLTVMSKAKIKPRKKRSVDTNMTDDEKAKQKFSNWKNEYYSEKFGVEAREKGFKERIVQEYIRALQWVLHYYYDGIVSWDWFYPFHYSPFISTITEYDITTMDVDTFSKGKPFTPFEQLMGVLPPASYKHVPVAFQHLMLSERSPIHDFYPLSFESDLNGKKNDWEAVVKLPFVDEHRLKAAMEPYRSQLTSVEQQNQKQGPELVFVYSQHNPQFYPSPWPEVYPHIEATTCHQSDMNQIDPPLIKGILPGVKMDGLWGFPTLSNVPHTAALTDEIKPTVFQHPSRNANCIVLTITRDHVDKYKTAEAAAPEFLGKTIYCGWPHLKHGLVTAVSDRKSRWFLGGNVDRAIESGTLHKLAKQSKAHSDTEQNQWLRSSHDIKNTYHNRKAIKVLEAGVVLHVRQSEGLKHIIVDKKVVMVTKFHHEETLSLIQCVAPDEQPFMRKVSSLKDHMPVTSEVFMVGKRFYGHKAKVVRVNGGKLDLEIEFLKVDPKLQGEVSHLMPVERYHEVVNVSRMINCPTRVLSQICSSCQIEMPTNVNKGKPGARGQRLDIGLNMKYQKKNMSILGYSRRAGERTWEYSQQAIDVLQKYKKQFPEVFRALAAQHGSDRLQWSAIYPGMEAKEARKKIESIRDWVKNDPVSSATAVSCGSTYLAKEAVRALVAFQDEYNQAQPKVAPRKIVREVLPNEVFKPIDSPVAVDLSADYQIGDRIVCTLKAGTIPYGLCGTVVSLYGDDAEMIDVVMDSTFIGGGSLDGRCPPGRGKNISTCGALNLTYGMRRETKGYISDYHNNRQQHIGSYVLSGGRRQQQLSSVQHVQMQHARPQHQQQAKHTGRTWSNIQTVQAQAQHGEFPDQGQIPEQRNAAKGTGTVRSGVSRGSAHQGPSLSAQPQQPKLAKPNRTTSARHIPTQAVKQQSTKKKNNLSGKTTQPSRQSPHVIDNPAKGASTVRSAQQPTSFIDQPSRAAGVPKRGSREHRSNKTPADTNLWTKLHNANAGAGSSQPQMQAHRPPSLNAPERHGGTNSDLWGALQSVGIVPPRPKASQAPPTANIHMEAACATPASHVSARQKEANARGTAKVKSFLKQLEQQNEEALKQQQT
eukprot:CFRG2793T1